MTLGRCPDCFLERVPRFQNFDRSSASACGNCCSSVTDIHCLKVAMWVLWESVRFQPRTDLGAQAMQSNQERRGIG